ncbi:arginine--tRNA ligase [Saprospiraceae bacterium]|nr:arginine--tRNA ligase [Saprospiraceae bacterium]
MDIVQILQSKITEAVKTCFDYDLSASQLLINPTKKEFEGEYTFVVFPLVKALRQKPQDIADTLGKHLTDTLDEVTAYNVIQGFLNLSIANDLWLSALTNVNSSENYGEAESNGKKILIEYSSPNTNKPLHLGHIRNILLGWSMCQIAEAAGYEVIKTKVVNDRGIAICKSMLAWQKYGEAQTPESASVKGDHFVGDFYVKFEKMFQVEYGEWQQSKQGSDMYSQEKKDKEESETFFKRYKNTYFNNHSAIGQEARQMLLAWEDGDADTKALWKRMNGWVYDGFNVTYKQLGVEFDDIVYESDTYLLGKDLVEEGLKSGVFYKKDDSSVWVDLEDEGMDQKLVLRSDGTSVYMTQDLGTAQVRFQKYGFDNMAYVVADEQDYHFQVLFKILKKLGEPYADNLHHLSYGMVDLTTGKMKSREGTVVDADNIMEEVIETAKDSAKERGGLEGVDDNEKLSIYSKVGLAALKYFILKINPRKRMTYNPAESMDMQGTTGPYIQNAYVRIQSIMRRVDGDFSTVGYTGPIADQEKDLIAALQVYPGLIKEAMGKYDPAVIANYCYTLAKSYHRYYHDYRILTAETEEIKTFRLSLSSAVAKVLKQGMALLGIEMPDYM